MPKRVDHDGRRREIADATWRLVAERGLDAVTMREISAALGVANGSLAHYFPGRDAIVEAAFRLVVDTADARVDTRVAGLTGVAALRALCHEVLPLDGPRLLEARAVVAFRQRALVDAGLAAVVVEAVAGWRRRIGSFLRDGRRAGEVVSPFPDEVLTEQVLSLISGAQDLAVLTPGATRARLQAQVLEAFLAGLAPAGLHVAPPAPVAPASPGFLSFAEVALDRTCARLPDTDRGAMALVLLLHRVSSSLVYDLESTVHRPAGWSWSAFRLLFTLWVTGEQEAGRTAQLCGMSRAAVSSLATTLAGAGLVARRPDVRDRRAVLLALTGEGHDRLAETFRRHNLREGEWARLLPERDLAHLTELLTALARAAQQADWINRRA